MSEPTLTEVFGTNSTQDINSLNISKLDLANTGLIALEENTAESLFVAIIKLAANYLKTANQELDPDIQVTISDPQEVKVFRNDLTYNQYIYNVLLDVVSPELNVDPNLF
ncbi:MAG: hypothetical protein QNJ51_13895 [Calothrix sp. MO_167.B12]|nr:hypothetical protein [Calothrix sp. MO_167.B12]